MCEVCLVLPRVDILKKYSDIDFLIYSKNSFKIGVSDRVKYHTCNKKRLKRDILKNTCFIFATLKVYCPYNTTWIILLKDYCHLYYTILIRPVC